MTTTGRARCACGAPLAVGAQAGVRKTVTVLFCDVTGSTALGESVDPEALRGLLARYFERMRAIVERRVPRAPGRPYEYFGYRAMARLSGTTPLSDLLAWLDEQDARGPAAAAESGTEAMRLHGEFGARSFASTVAGRLGEAVYELGRLDEAVTWAGRAAELGASDDAVTQMLWRQVRAKVVASRGEHAEAERLAREALAIGEETDLLSGVADAYSDLGEVLALAGRADETAAAFAEALARYERKENLVMAERTRKRVAGNAVTQS